MGAKRGSRWRRVWLRVVVPLVAMLAVGTGGACVIDHWVPERSPLRGRDCNVAAGQKTLEDLLGNLPEDVRGSDSPRQFMSKMLVAGEMAPEIVVPSLDGKEPFDLARYRGVKPVVLVFASFSCDIFHGGISSLEALYGRYGDRVAFAFISVPEAGHEMPGYEFLLQDVKRTFNTDEEFAQRCKRVQKAKKKAGVSLPGYCDPPDARASRAYWAWPARLVVLDRDGRIVCDFGSVLGGGWNWERLSRTIDALATEAETSAQSVDRAADPKGS